MRKEYLYGILCAAFVSLGFGGGYLSAKSIYSGTEKNIDKTLSAELEIKDYDDVLPPTESVTAEVNVPVSYLLEGEGDNLTLYEVNGEEKNVIKTVKFSFESLPEEDRRKLKSGIVIQSVEDGYGLIEDFTS